MKDKLYHWMVRETPQREWVMSRGMFLWLAFFFTEMGAGIYLVSIFLDLPQGRLLGWCVSLVLGGITHMLYLGQPLRAWRMFLKPFSTELSRGLLATAVFGAIGFIQVAPVIIPGLPWSGSCLVLNIIMGVLSVLVISHGFLTMSSMTSIPMWNSSMMLPLSIISGIWVGSQASEVLTAVLGLDCATAELWSRWSLFCFMAIMSMYLFGNMHASSTIKISTKEILKGPVALHFYIGVLFVGMIVPLVITLMVWGKDPGTFYGLLLVRMLCVLTGDLLMRYSLLRSGMYRPIVRHNTISLNA